MSSLIEIHSQHAEECNYLEPIVTEGTYNSEESLMELIQRISCPDSQVYILDYINLVIKYTVAYIFENEGEKPGTEKLVNYVYHRLAAVFRDSVASSFRPSGPIEEKILRSKYQLEMLSDIASTVAIVRDIVERPLERQTGNYTGIDLGTGSGILLLAQYIQARRNGYGQIQNIGIEKSHVAATASNRLIGSLEAGVVYQGDTTDTHVFERIGCIREVLSFVTNENLPRRGCPFYKKTPNGTQYEPFFSNIESLQRYYPKSTLEKSQYFPHMLVWGELGSKENSERLTGQDGYGIDFAKRVGKIAKNSIPQNEHELYSTIYPIGIVLYRQREVTPLDQVGYPYIRRGLFDIRKEAHILNVSGITGRRW